MQDQFARIACGQGAEVAHFHQLVARHRAADDRSDGGFRGAVQILFDEQRTFVAAAQPDGGLQTARRVVERQQVRQEPGQFSTVARAIHLGDEGLGVGAAGVVDIDQRAVGEAVRVVCGNERQGRCHEAASSSAAIKRR